MSFPEKTFKDRRIVLKKGEIFHDIDALSYKLAETSVQDQKAKDAVASDAEDRLDGSIIFRLMNLRVANIRRRLAFCIRKEEVLEVDNTPAMDGEYVFDMSLQDKFDDNNLEVAMTYMHEYVVRGTLLDWYRKIGTGFGEGLVQEVDNLESKIVDAFRSEIVRHPGLPYMRSYRTR